MSLPWLSQPVMLHSSRDTMGCDMTPEQCAFKSQYWVFWYEADHRFGLPTVALFLVAILLFGFGHAFSTYGPRRWKNGTLWRKVLASSRLLSYTSWRIGDWNSQSLGAYLLGAVGLIFFFAMMFAPRPYYWPNTEEISYGNSPPLATRAGWMAVACLPFLILLGTKANPIATLTGTSHEKLIVWHNWVAWIMFVLALVHTFPFIVFHIWKGDIVTEWNTGGIWVTGVIAILAQAWLTFMSIRWLRERYYEFFKVTHFLAAAIFVVFFFIHCDFRLTAWDYFIATGVLYSASWLYSQCRMYLEHGTKLQAHLSLATDKMVKITIATGAQWRPGQHIYLKFLVTKLHPISSHPFTICSSPRSGGHNQMICYVKRHDGLTSRLLNLAAKKPEESIGVLLDGPYGGVPSRWSAGFDQIVVVGGGSGAGFTLPLAEYFLEHAQARDRSGKMVLAVTSRDRGLQKWYLEALGQMALRLTGDEKGESFGLSVQIHDTSEDCPNSTTTDEESQVVSGKSTDSAQDDDEIRATAIKAFGVQFFKGRPDVKSLAGDAVGVSGASVGLVVCGPSSMVHDMRQTAASAQRDILKGGQGAKEVWFHTESFSS